jgi:hypothetical protein
LPFKLPKPKTNPDGYERLTPIEKFAERILVPEKGSVIVPLTNVVFAVIARVIDALIGKLHRVSVFAAREIVPLTVARLSLAKLMDANVPNVFFLNKPAKGVPPRLSDYGRNSSVATRWLVLFGRNFGARSSLTPSFATACSCSSNILRGWKLADFFKSSRAIAKNGSYCQAVLLKG